MKKQEEIFREIQEMMGETKEGRIRWSVEVMTTEANPAEEKPVEHEDGLDWTIDECYVSYYCKYKGKYKAVHADFTKFKDSNKISSYAKWGMNWAIGNKIINGSNGKLNPQGTATRAEAAAMLSNYCKSVK